MIPEIACFIESLRCYFPRDICSSCFWFAGCWFLLASKRNQHSIKNISSCRAVHRRVWFYSYTVLRLIKDNYFQEKELRSTGNTSIWIIFSRSQLFPVPFWGKSLYKNISPKTLNFLTLWTNVTPRTCLYVQGTGTWSTGIFLMAYFLLWETFTE